MTDPLTGESLPVNQKSSSEITTAEKGAVRLAASQYEQSAARYRAEDRLSGTAHEHERLAALLRGLAEKLRVTP